MRWVQRYIPDFEKRWWSYARPVGSSWRIDETYLKVKGQWVYLSRGVDQAGQTLDFFLSAHRDRAAAERFLQQAIEKRGISEKITREGNAAWHEAVGGLQKEGTLPAGRTGRTNNYLNNGFAQDHRRVKQRVRPRLGFKRFNDAAVTLRASTLPTRARNRNLTCRLCVPLTPEHHRYGRPCWRREQPVMSVLPYCHFGNYTGTRAQAEVIDGSEDEGTIDCKIGVDPRCSRSQSRFRVPPCRHRLFIEPHREAATVDQCTIVRMPLADPITEDRGWFGHEPILVTTSSEGNLQQRRSIIWESAEMTVVVMTLLRQLSGSSRQHMSGCPFRSPSSRRGAATGWLPCRTVYAPATP